MFGLLNGLVAEYPPTVQPAAKAHLYQTRFCQTPSDEQAAFEQSFVQVRAAWHPLRYLPLVVLTRGQQVPESWQTLQKDLASLSTNSTQMIATRSGHFIQLEQPDLVIAAIKQVLIGKV